MAVLGGAQRNATVRCTEAMDVLVLPRREFAMLSGSLPELWRSFEITAGERARSIGSQ